MKKEEDLELLRHSMSHVMAAAILELWPDAKFAIGPAIENGFYYDIDFGEQKIIKEDLLKIEKKMKFLLKQNIKFERTETTIDEAIAREKKSKQDYKVELLEDLEGKGEKKVSYYKLGKFEDLCRGPHIESTKEIKAGSYKLLKLAGAYWRGDEKNKMLTRIYAAGFLTKEEMDNHLEMLKEAEKRDHRKLGKQLGLFVFSDLIGPGLPIYTDKGAIIRREIVNFSNELQKSIGYKEVYTPNMNKAELFKVSGHYDKYKDDMLRVVSNYTDEEYYLKPMNCPHHTQIYASQIRSYKDLPLRISDFANLYRDEKPGELSGLSRLRCFSQDDGHSFCREDQIKEEFLAVLGIVEKAYAAYGMDYWVRLSLWDPGEPEKYLGDSKVWEKSQKLLEEILVEEKKDYKKVEGEAAIYGPKMDFISRDALGREWQNSTIQLDFIMPERFGLKYADSDGKEKTPIMIHRAIIGSPERFLGILLEHYAGAFPLWLAPVQVKLIAVSEKHCDFVNNMAKEFDEENIRTEVDISDETVGNKIRKAIGEKVPCMLVIGDKEVNSDKLHVRDRGSDQVREIKKEEFINEIRSKVADKK